MKSNYGVRYVAVNHYRRKHLQHLLHLLHQSTIRPTATNPLLVRLQIIYILTNSNRNIIAIPFVRFVRHQLIAGEYGHMNDDFSGRATTASRYHHMNYCGHPTSAISSNYRPCYDQGDPGTVE